MDKQPMFFRDEDAMGDVLAEAQTLLIETKQEAQALEESIQSERESVDDYREQVEGVRYRQAIKELVGKGVEDVKVIVAGLVTEWKEKKLQMKQREEELAMQYQAVLEQEQILVGRIQDFEAEQRDHMNNELQNIAQLSANVSGQLAELEKTKNAIDTILTEDAETIRDKVLTQEDVAFLRLNYFSLVQSRLSNEGVINPVTEEEYGKNEWKVETTNEEIHAKIIKGVLQKHIAVGFEVKYIVPEAEEGFIYKKSGKEVSDVITKYLQAKTEDTNSFTALVLVSPTGWNEWSIEKVENILNMNKSVYLVDLSERTIVYNENDKKTKLFADWFVPVPIEEEITDMVTKLDEEVEGGTQQFRADKVAASYQVPRKIVIGAFREMVDEGKGEIIMPEEGVKDVLLVVR
jgi:hypothetical protein